MITDKLGQAIAAIVLVMAIYIAFSKLTLYGWLDKIFIGSPSILIKHGKLVKNNLKRSRYSLMELLSSIRLAGYPDIRSVEYAILEPNGGVSVIPKHAVSCITPKDLGIEVDYVGLPIAIVVDGRIQKRNLDLIGRNEDWLKSELHKKGYNNANKIFLATVRDINHSIVIDQGNGELE